MGSTSETHDAGHGGQPGRATHKDKESIDMRRLFLGFLLIAAIAIGGGLIANTAHQAGLSTAITTVAASAPSAQIGPDSAGHPSRLDDAEWHHAGSRRAPAHKRDINASLAGRASARAQRGRGPEPPNRALGSRDPNVVEAGFDSPARAAVPCLEHEADLLAGPRVHRDGRAGP